MSDLDDLLAGLTGGTEVAATTTPAVVAVAPAAAVVEEFDLDGLLDAVEPPAKTIAPTAPAAELEIDLADLLADAPTTVAAQPEPEAPTAPAATAKALKKGGKKGDKKQVEKPADVPETDGAATTDAPPATEEVEKKRQARIFFAKKTDRLRHRLGEQIAEFTLRELPDTDELTDEMVLAEKDACLADIDALGVKPQNRATMIVEYLAGKASTLNSVIADAFKLLHSEGKVEMGTSGNLLKLLTSRYSSGSARAMGGNTLIAMRTLKIIDQAGSVNPRSLIYPAIIEKLGLASEDQKAA